MGTYFMKDFGKPAVTISAEEYAQLKECQGIVKTLWHNLGPYNWPAEFRLPPKKTLLDFLPEERELFAVGGKIADLFGWDDSE